MPKVKRNPHDPLLEGNALSYLAVGYYPKEELRKWLPRGLSIPSDTVMAKEYPTVKEIKGMHPFTLMFSKNSKVHTMASKSDLRPYRELMFFFPVICTHKNEEQLCSYVRLLYLDWFLGVIGGLSLGLRKQFRPSMTDEQTDTSQSYGIKDILNASFQQTSTDSRQELDPFFAQTFKNPTVTVSYINRTFFYTTKVYPDKVLDASPVYEWNYKGSVIKNNDNTIANYSEYHFTISAALRYKAYFHPTASAE